jgi:hypothetical protein
MVTATAFEVAVVTTLSLRTSTVAGEDEDVPADAPLTFGVMAIAGAEVAADGAMPTSAVRASAAAEATAISFLDI